MWYFYENEVVLMHVKKTKMPLQFIGKAFLYQHGS